MLLKNWLTGFQNGCNQALRRSRRGREFRHRGARRVGGAWSAAVAAEVELLESRVLLAALADDCAEPENAAVASSISHSGSSPFDPPEATDQVFVADIGPFLDTGCSYRSEGPLVIELEIDRFFGDVEKLSANGLLPTTVTLQLPAFDVDVNGVSGFPPERDRVTFIDKNGSEHVLGFLDGDNQIWQVNSFQIPIDWLDLPTDPGKDNLLQPTSNTIRIDIDTASGNSENWCTAIDWVSLELPAPDPVLLVHGILPFGDTWSGPWTSGLTELGIPFEAIELGFPALDSIQNNAGKIDASFEEMQNRFGIDKINIVAHSKGGLDSREFAESHDVVDRLIQIGTPNAGSPLADVIQAGLIDIGGIIPALFIDLLAPAAYQLTTAYMELYNATHSFNPNSEYISLAGDYTFGGLGIVDGLFESFYGGPSDLVVAVSSVHSLSNTHLSYASTGGNHQAQHTSLTKSEDIYNILIPYVTGILPHHANFASALSPGLFDAGALLTSTAGPASTATLLDLK
ncbi:MAG: alpha/beta hydrolase [Planctomycetaceae bacterium]|nr:alpha/beta hydrolase [Planctomycetaceae bacterium]